jgi:hypothetical protein
MVIIIVYWLKMKLFPCLSKSIYFRL